VGRHGPDLVPRELIREDVMKAYQGFLLVVGVAALSACGVPIRYGAHFSDTWAPDRQTTFAWRDEADRTMGDSRLAGNRFFHQKLHEAVEWELSLRGIRYDENDPDLVIHHHLSLADHVYESEVVDDSGATVTETGVYEGGSLVLHMVDARTHEDVWVAWGEANVEPAFRSPASMESWVYDLVGHMFGEWPVNAR
jgi:hypothetical protein